MIQAYCKVVVIVQIDWQRVAPVLVSIGIIILVAIVRSYSRALTVILATMPINIPLAMYIVSSGNPEDKEGFADFVGGLIIGLIPTIFFLFIAYFTARAGWGIWSILIAGYIGWAICLGVVLLVQRLIAG